MKAMERKQKKFLNDNYDSVVAAEKEEQGDCSKHLSYFCIFTFKRIFCVTFHRPNLMEVNFTGLIVLN